MASDTPANTGKQCSSCASVGIGHRRRYRHGKDCWPDPDRTRRDRRPPAEGGWLRPVGPRRSDRGAEGGGHKIEREIVAEAKRDDDVRRLARYRVLAPSRAATIKALVPDPGGFRSGRHFAAWLGLTPQSHSSGSRPIARGIDESDQLATIGTAAAKSEVMSARQRT